MMKGKKRRGRRGKSRPERKNIKEKETRRWKERRKKEKEKQVDGLCYSVFVTESLHCEGRFLSVSLYLKMAGPTSSHGECGAVW